MQAANYRTVTNGLANLIFKVYQISAIAVEGMSQNSERRIFLTTRIWIQQCAGYSQFVECPTDLSIATGHIQDASTIAKSFFPIRLHKPVRKYLMPFTL
mmetsp:Transcript_17101/g.49087  ORF Transcript_17101/g.49087 Transcript_17101/m.49087 type:complete len:99 (-) Transcript_17101:469-765(-)